MTTFNPASGLAAVIEKRKDEKPKVILDAVLVGLDIFETLDLSDKDKTALGLIRTAAENAANPDAALAGVNAMLSAIGTLTAPAPKRASNGGKGKGGVDPRLPSVGSVLTREFKGTLYKVEVLEGGKIKTLHDNAEHSTVSGAAQHITGKATNGYDFFHINGNARRQEAEPATAAAPTDATDADASDEGKGKAEAEPATAASGKGKGKGK